MELGKGAFGVVVKGTYRRAPVHPALPSHRRCICPAYRSPPSIMYACALLPDGPLLRAGCLHGLLSRRLQGADMPPCMRPGWRR